MSMVKDVLYVAPLVEVIEVEVEKGFAVSGDGQNDSMNPVGGN